MPNGELAIVLHTHMPYVEGFGTWPFGEEWLWEAMVGCYLPLLDLLDGGAPLTLSLTGAKRDTAVIMAAIADLLPAESRVRHEPTAEELARTKPPA